MTEYLKKYRFDFSVIIAFSIFIIYSLFFQFNPGIDILKNNFWEFLKEMLIALPVMFILIGLFDVWVSKERVQRHIGDSSGVKGVLLVMLLAFVQAGPLYAAFPVVYILKKKGASSSNIFIYLSSFTMAKVPMLTFEIGFLGLEFSLLRLILSIPVFILIGLIMGRYFDKHKGALNEV